MAIAFINRVDVFSGAPGTNPQVFSTAATNHTAGNLLVACFVTQGDGTPTITDTALNTYTAAGAVVTNSVNRVWIYYAENIAGHGSNVVQFSIPNSLGSVYHAATVLQFSGVASSSSLDDNDGNTGFGTTASTPSLTLSTAEGVICAIAEADDQNQIAGSGYTLVIIDDALGGFSAYEYKIVSSSEAPTMSCGNGDWRMKSALFKGLGGGGAVVLLGQGVM